MNIAIVTVHPDDLEFLMGGTAIKYVQKGHKVVNILCTNGDAGSPTITPKEKIAETRYKEALEGAKIMGTEVVWLGFHDEFLLDNDETRLAVLDALREVEPDIVFALNRNDLSSADHRVGANLAMDMSFIICAQAIQTKNPIVEKVPALYFMDTPGGLNFTPREYVDISDAIDLKEKALAKHISQFAWMDKLNLGNKITENMLVQNRFRGLQCGVMYAEAFEPYNTFSRGRVNSLLPQYI